MPAVAAQVGMVSWEVPRLERGALAWWWWDPDSVHLTDPTQARLGVGGQLSSYTWTCDRPSGEWQSWHLGLPGS